MIKIYRKEINLYYLYRLVVDFMKIKVGVFFGGNSVEHEVSIISAIQAIENMDKEKYDIIPIYIAKDNRMYCGKNVGDIMSYRDINKLIKSSEEVVLANRNNRCVLVRNGKRFSINGIFDYIDVAFPIVHGTNVEDGTIEGYLKMFNLPFVGCSVLASAIGMDKYVCKCVLRENDIPVIDGILFYVEEYKRNVNEMIKKIEVFGMNVIVKPVNLGSSIGISVAKNRDELKKALDLAFRYSEKVLVERLVENLMEINCSVVGSRNNMEVSECEEPIKRDEILSFTDKYISGKKGSKLKGSVNSGKLKLPADISIELKNEIQELAKKVFFVLDCSGVVRIDFIYDKDKKKLYVNEINTIPGSLAFHLWREKGVCYRELLDRLIETALERERIEKKLIFSFDSNILEGFNGVKVK